SDRSNNPSNKLQGVDMNTRRLLIASFLFLLGIIVALPLPKYAKHPDRQSSAGLLTPAAASGLTVTAPEQTQQPTVTIIRTIVYHRISDFQEGGGICTIQRIKLSADGSKLIFISGQKVFTMDATGQNFREVFDAG